MYNQALVMVQHNTAHMSRLYAFDGRCASAEDARPLLACALLLLHCTPQLLLLLLQCLLLLLQLFFLILMRAEATAAGAVSCVTAHCHVFCSTA
jgi:hypothetical protein